MPILLGFIVGKPRKHDGANRIDRGACDISNLGDKLIETHCIVCAEKTKEEHVKLPIHTRRDTGDSKTKHRFEMSPYIELTMTIEMHIFMKLDEVKQIRAC